MIYQVSACIQCTHTHTTCVHTVHTAACLFLELQRRCVCSKAPPGACSNLSLHVYSWNCSVRAPRRARVVINDISGECLHYLITHIVSCVCEKLNLFLCVYTGSTSQQHILRPLSTRHDDCVCVFMHTHTKLTALLRANNLSNKIILI